MDRVAKKSQQLQDVQDALQTYPFDIELQHSEQIIKAEYQTLVNAEMSLLSGKQK